MRLAAALTSLLPACLLLTACPSKPERPNPERAETAASATAATQASGEAAAVVVPPLPGSAERAVATHLSPATPAAAAPCKPLPAGSGFAHELARVMRELACTPSLYYQSEAQVRAGLKLPAGVTFRFSGPRFASLTFEEAPPTAELVKAMGISKPVITTATRGAWATHNWHLGSDPKTGRMDIWGPGNASIGVSHTADLKDTLGTVKPLTDEPLNGYITVAMPESVIAVKDDDVALRMLIHAVTKLAQNRALLNKEPEEIAKVLGVDDGRFRVSRVSIGTGPSAIKGVDIWTARSQIAAEPVVKTFGMTGKVEHERAHDSDSIVLHREPSEPHTSGDEHPYKGLKLQPMLEPRSGVTLGDSDQPKDYVLEGLRIMPGK